ncbi:MAG: arsenate reductase ArsC [Nitrospiria bacterium]
MKILFLCVANSARSQIAEGLAKQMFGGQVEVYSAGSKPGGKIHPGAIEVMKDIGIDISMGHPKFHEDLPQEFLAGLNVIITLCAEEACSALSSSKAIRLHWPVQDPVFIDNKRGEGRQGFYETRDKIREKLVVFAKKEGLYPLVGVD